MIKCLHFLTIYTKLVPQTVSYIHYAIKFYLESFVSIYQLYHLFEIIYLFTKVFYNLGITLINNWFISKTINMTLSKNAPWVPDILSGSLTYCFQFFSAIATFEVTSRIFVHKCFNSNSLVIFPLIGTIIKWKL